MSRSPLLRPPTLAPALVLGASFVLASSGVAFAQPATPSTPAPTPAATPTPAAPSGAAATLAPAAAKKDKPLTDAQKQKRAREAYAAAEKKAAAGDTAGALDDYRTSDGLVSTTQSRFKVAQSLDKLGKSAEAVEMYQKLLAEPPSDATAEARSTAAARVEELTIASVAISSVPTGAKLVVDGTPAPAPAPTTLRLKAGKHTVEASLPSYEKATREIDAAPGASTEVKVELMPLAPPAPPEVSAAATASTPAPAAVALPPRSKLPAYVTLGLAGAGAVVGTIYGIKAVSAKKDFDNHPSTDNADTTERNALIADMAFGAAITLGITGVVLLVADDERPAAQKTGFRFAPLAGPHVQGASASFSFLAIPPSL